MNHLAINTTYMNKGVIQTPKPFEFTEGGGAMSQSVQSTITKQTMPGAREELQPQFIPASARKRSADDSAEAPTEFKFDNQLEGNNGGSSQGKMSLSSMNRPNADNLSAFSKQRPQVVKHRTLEYYYSKQAYNKIVKRLSEDPSSIWYDNLEQMKKDYADMKEIYDLVCIILPTETPG